jgi:hypothetical protein
LAGESNTLSKRPLRAVSKVPNHLLKVKVNGGAIISTDVPVFDELSTKKFAVFHLVQFYWLFLNVMTRQKSTAFFTFLNHYYGIFVDIF